jgi:hypothetical protein
MSANDRVGMGSLFAAFRRSAPWLQVAAIAFLLAAPLSAVAVPTVPATGLAVEVSITGELFVSADGSGSNTGSSTIQVEKPNASATVNQAFLTCATFGGHTIADLGIALDVGSGPVGIVWDQVVNNADYINHLADVMAIVASPIDAAAPGLISFTQVEVANTTLIDGCGLYVIFDDPNQTRVSTVFFLFGGLSSAGDDFSVTLARPLESGELAEMGLAISFGFQQIGAPTNLCGTGGAQRTFIDVNGTRVTSCAGHYDDSVEDGENGNLITVGGIGDLPDNPVDPFQEPGDGLQPRVLDDELYDLTPFLTPTDTLIFVETINPDNSDNIFAGHIVVTGEAIEGGGCLLSPATATNFVGEQHTVTLKCVDDVGAPIEELSVRIEVVSGPHVEFSGSGFTDANGEFSFDYTGIGTGTDTIEGGPTNVESPIDPALPATKEWIEAVTIDIMPGVEPKIIDPNIRAKFPVAILGSEVLDVTDVNVDSLTFGPAGAAPFLWAGVTIEDINEDESPDLVVYFRIEETGLSNGDYQACLVGELLDTTPFVACGAIETPAVEGAGGVPEPAQIWQLIGGLAGLGWMYRLRRRS